MSRMTEREFRALWERIGSFSGGVGIYFPRIKPTPGYKSNQNKNKKENKSVFSKLKTFIRKILPAFIFAISITTCGCDNIGSDRSSSLMLLDPDLRIGTYFEYGSDKVSEKILFFGDSRIQMMDMEGSFPDKHIFDYSMSGSTSMGILIRSRNMHGYVPDVVIISIGINDIGRYVLSGYSSWITRFIPNLSESIGAIRETNRSVKIYVTGIVPDTISHRNHVAFQKLTVILNEKIKMMCADIGAKYIPMEDMNDADGYLEKSYSVDGVHYNDVGYSVFVSVLKNNISYLKL